MKRYLRAALISLTVLVIVASTAVLVTASIWPTLNRVETGRTLEYPELLPRTYQLGYDRVYDEALAAVQEQPEWTVVEQQRATGIVRARMAMPITGWGHEVTVRVERRGEFVSRVFVLSEGHDAPGDLGQNARNIRTYLEALDGRLGASAVD